MIILPRQARDIHRENSKTRVVFSYQLGGNAVFMHGYNRWHNISRSEFVWLGDSAVALVGRSQLADATAGDFPQDVSVTHNVMHEVGIITKQASPYFQTVAASNLIHANVMFNGPRAGIK